MFPTINKFQHTALLIVFIIGFTNALFEEPELAPLGVTNNSKNIFLARPKVEGIKRIYQTNMNDDLLCTCPKKQLINNPELYESPRQILTPLSVTRNGAECSKLCEEEIIPFSRFIDKNCGTSGKIIEIGYEIDYNTNFTKFISTWINQRFDKWSIHFLRMVEICFDIGETKTIFMRHKVRASKFFLPSERLPNPITYQSVFGENLDDFYEEGNQKSVFTQLFPNDHEKYFVGPSSKKPNPKRYFIKYQLISHREMILMHWKKSTFFNILTIPVWSTLESTMNSVTDFIHYVARKTNLEPIVYSGTYDYLKISGKPIILVDSHNKNQLRIPRLIWKLMYLKTCKMGIVMFVHNNIDDPKTSNKKICEPQTRVINKHIKNVYYCHFGENLKKKLHLNHINVEGVLDLKALLRHSSYLNSYCMYREDTNEEFYTDNESKQDLDKLHQIYSDEELSSGEYEEEDATEVPITFN